MKKNILIITAVILTLSAVNMQADDFQLRFKKATFADVSSSQSTTGPGTFEFGVKAGVNIFKISGKAFDEQFRFGYHLGVFVYGGINDSWGIQPELMWSSSRTRVGTNPDNVYSFNNASDISLNYLSIPVLLTLKPNEIISLQAGPQFGILINPHETTVMNGSNAFSGGDVSLVLGSQLNMSTFKAGLRYVIGLNNINDISDQDKWSSQGIQIYVGLKLL